MLLCTQLSDACAIRSERRAYPTRRRRWWRPRGRGPGSTCGRRPQLALEIEMFFQAAVGARLPSGLRRVAVCVFMSALLLPALLSRQMEADARLTPGEGFLFLNKCRGTTISQLPPPAPGTGRPPGTCLSPPPRLQHRQWLQTQPARTRSLSLAAPRPPAFTERHAISVGS